MSGAGGVEGGAAMARPAVATEQVETIERLSMLFFIPDLNSSSLERKTTAFCLITFKFLFLVFFFKFFHLADSFVILFH